MVLVSDLILLKFCPKIYQTKTIIQADSLAEAAGIL
jgi:hypothetical protein